MTDKNTSPNDIGKNANCYKCVNRGGVAGSAHSSCTVFNKGEITEMDRIQMAFQGDWQRLRLTGKCEETGDDISVPAIEANSHGIQNGWFLFPIDFDPCWLERCVFFTEKEENES